jgi:hypothetical protein
VYSSPRRRETSSTCCELILEDALGVVEQAADQRDLPSSTLPHGGEAQQLCILVERRHQK